MACPCETEKEFNKVLGDRLYFPGWQLLTLISLIWQFTCFLALPRPQSTRFLFLSPWLLLGVCPGAAVACSRWLVWAIPGWENPNPPSLKVPISLSPAMGASWGAQFGCRYCYGRQGWPVCSQCCCSRVGKLWGCLTSCWSWINKPSILSKQSFINPICCTASGVAFASGTQLLYMTLRLVMEWHWRWRWLWLYQAIIPVYLNI